MKRILVIGFYFVTSLSIVNYLNAQTPGNAFNQMASLPLQAPQASSLSKFVEYPVSYYNGRANISVPVYSVEYADISIPISLNYHGGGIKVNEEASWVGLGWTLDVGGVISHDIKGGDDEYGSNHLFNQVFVNNSGINYNPTSMVNWGICYNGLYNSAGSPYNCSNLYTLAGAPDTDGEPDMYVYRFGEYSGKFFSGIGGFVDMGRNNIKFQIAGLGFIAITPNGYTYTFDKVEKAWSYPTTHATNTAYYLTRITSPRGKIVTFQYKSFKEMIDYQDQIGQSWRSQYPSEINSAFAWGNDNTVAQLPALSEHFTQIQFLGGAALGASEQVGLHQIYSSTTSSNYYLDKIIFDNGYIDFIKSPRNDLYGVKLDAIKIYQSNGILLKSIPFSYDYFISDKTDDDIYDRVNKVTHLEPSYDARVDHYPVSFRNRRLKLLNVSIEPQPHTFQYIEGTTYTNLPYKTSFAQDFWGFYNGRNNPSLIPDYDLYSQQMSLPSQLSIWNGANREVSVNHIRAAMLSKIYYPTGGYSEFIYDLNQFANLSPQQQTTYQLANYGGIDAGAGVQKFYFSISSDTYCDITGGLYCNGMLDMNSTTYNCGCLSCSGDQINTLYAHIEKVDPVTHAFIAHYPEWDFQLSNQSIRDAGGSINMPNQLFNPGTYCITVNYPDNHIPPGDIPNNRRAELNVKFYEPVSGQNAVALGGGIRIGAIMLFDPVTKQMLHRKFTYAGGKMMRYPVFFSVTPYQRVYQIEGGPQQRGDYMHYYLYSTPAYPYSFSANGSSVGYDYVTETTGVSPLGKTVYSYQNYADIVNANPNAYLPGVPSLAYPDNGFLKNISIYDNDNAVVKETINERTMGVTNTYWAFKGKYMSDASVNNVVFANEYKFSFYPIQVGKILTTKTTQKDYANGTVVNTVKDFTYNSNGLLKQEKLTSSNLSTVASNYAYASDYTSVTTGWINDLKDKNFIAIPLEVLSTRNDLVTGGVFTSYTVNGNIITPNQVYRIETSAPINISSSAPSGTLPGQFKLDGALVYDNNGNLKQSSPANDIYTSHLWGYNKAYPVATVVGADYTTISGLVNQTILDNPSSDLALRNELNNLRTGLAATKALVTTYTYKPVVGINSITNPNNKTSYYEYDSYGRVILIRDQDKNIIKKICYNYAGQFTDCTTTSFTNDQQQATYTKIGCAAGTIAPSYTYTVPINTYISYVSKDDANEMAIAALNTNGQAAANALSCLAAFNATNTTSIPWNVTVTKTDGAFTQTYSLYPNQINILLANIPVGTYNLAITYMYSPSNSQLILNGTTYTGTSFNLTSISITTATSFTLQNAPVPCSFSMSSGYSLVTSGISSNGSVVSFYIVFYRNAPMTAGNTYTVATINGSCRPSATRTINYSSSGRSWTITIYPSGQMNWYLNYGSPQVNTNSTVGTSTLTYNQ